MMKKIILLFFTFHFSLFTFAQNVDGETGATKRAHVNATAGPVLHSRNDSVIKRVSKFMKAVSRLHVGGYGEAVASRNFYSDNVFRYRNPELYRNAPSHGRVDIPHAVINLGYDFGKGWTFNTEIEYEHGGTGTSWEREFGEGGELEAEYERGGEVELEQFWLNKEFFHGKLNIKAGHIIVPVGLNNSHHEPLNFFTVYRPEGEDCIMPSTWHQTGVSLWGNWGMFRYEAQFIGGLDAKNFTVDNWIKNGKNSAFEFDVANKYAVDVRLDVSPVKGLRFGLSGYYGQCLNNSAVTVTNDKYKNLKGNLYIGSFDFTLDRWNWIVRGQADYGYLSAADKIVNYPERGVEPYSSGDVAPNAYAFGLEAGYDFFSQIHKMKRQGQKMYVFARGETYDPYCNSNVGGYDYTRKIRIAAGINYMPIKQIVVKAEYSYRWLRSGYINEPSLNIGIAWQGWFL